mgnify:CR=1 FL=1
MQEQPEHWKLRDRQVVRISDDEDGFTYYYTKIDPNKENFKLSATFEITDTSLTPDNQTGFGIVAADALGLNVWGNPDYVHKYFNYASSMMFSSKQSNPFMRTVTGYTSADTSSNDGVERTVTNSKFTDQTAKFEVGNKYTFSLEKTDEGYTATCNGSEQKLSDNYLYICTGRWNSCSWYCSIQKGICKGI